MHCLKPFDMIGWLAYKLHPFSDAPGGAYGAISHLRLVNKCRKVHCLFVLGSSHFTPASVTTVPWLELLAVILSLRLN